MKNSILKCDRCGSYHWADIYKCGCGSKQFSTTHPTNAEFVVESPLNLYNQYETRWIEKKEQLLDMVINQIV